MSAEAFGTVLSCDMRTGEDGRSIEYSPSGTGTPRWMDIDPNTGAQVSRGWADCYVYAEQAIKIAADAVRDQPMTGSTGDHPNMRQQVARILDATAALVRVLALDSADDSYVTNAKYQAALDKIVFTVGDAREYGDEQGIRSPSDTPSDI
jgi:hypothetical protein